VFTLPQALLWPLCEKAYIEKKVSMDVGLLITTRDPNVPE